MANISTSRMTRQAKVFEAALYSEDIPHTVEEAMKHQHWRDAMKKEMEALQSNNTWEKSQLPEGKKPVGCRWVFTIKRKADGTVERYKARLVAKGYTQTYGIDYDETFSPVAKMSSIRVLLSVAACKDWPLHQFDVTNAFLHGELKKNVEVYMDPPPGYTEDFGEGQVCRLKKTLYGLRQSPRVWFGRFCQAMKKYGYKQSGADHTLFLKKKGENITCLIIYVDDMIITGNDVKEIEDLKKNLSQEFAMKDLGALKYFLGIEVLRSKRGIFLRQKEYILDLLAETGMKKYGYKQSGADHTLFLKKKGENITCLIIYVDDMIITGNDVKEIEDLKKNLSQEFAMKDLGALKYFLGIEVLRSKRGIFLRQKKYILDLLAETGMLECKPEETPIMVNHKLNIVEGAATTNQGRYQRLVGKLIYLSHTRPDIAYAVGVVSQFMHEPQEEHMNAVLRILRYLKGTAGYGVLLRKVEDLEVQAYTDADWGSNPVDYRSTAGYFTFVGGNLVTGEVRNKRW